MHIAGHLCVQLWPTMLLALKRKLWKLEFTCLLSRLDQQSPSSSGGWVEEREAPWGRVPVVPESWVSMWKGHLGAGPHMDVPGLTPK
jgi:hypothetical protein